MMLINVDNVDKKKTKQKKIINISKTNKNERKVSGIHLRDLTEKSHNNRYYEKLELVNKQKISFRRRVNFVG